MKQFFPGDRNPQINLDFFHLFSVWLLCTNSRMSATIRVILLSLLALLVVSMYFPSHGLVSAQSGTKLHRERRDCNSCGQECSVLCRVPDRRWKFCCMNYVRKKRGYYNPLSLRTLQRTQVPDWERDSALASVNLVPEYNPHMSFQYGGPSPNAVAPPSVETEEVVPLFQLD